MKRYAVFGLLWLVALIPAAQAQKCYTAKQIEAEQGLRIHSELMVIALTCMKTPNGAGLYEKYNIFTRKNQSVLSAYESDLINYFRAQGKGNPEKEFHNLRTGLANKISTYAVNTSVVSFCQQFAPRIDQALAMDSAKFQRWAKQGFADAPTTRQACKKSS